MKASSQIQLVALCLLLLDSLQAQVLSQEDADRAVREALLEAGMGTTAFQAETYTRGGDLYGCGWSFTHVLFDNTYRQGRPSILHGSLNSFFYPDRDFSVSLKLQGMDVAATPHAQLRNEYFAIPFAYIETAPGETTAKKYAATFECENKAFCGVFVEGAIEALEHMAEGVITIGYQRKAGSSDVRFELNPSNVPSHKEEMVKGWHCMSRLLELFKADAEQ